MRSFLVYIAGPYRSDSESGVRRNIEAARQLAESVWRAGMTAVCPHLNSAFMGGIVPDQAFLDGDLAILARCDAMLLCPKWKESVGTRAEAGHAARLGIPSFYADEMTALRNTAKRTVAARSQKKETA